MKKISITLLALAAAVLAVSCQKEEVRKGSAPMTISAVTEGIETQQTKAEMAYKYDVLWNEGDRISVKNSSESAEFTLTDGAGTTKGTFTSSTSISGDVEAYYPASVANLVWPSVQHNNEVCPMYCTKNLSSTENQTFSFSSLGSVLQIVFNSTPSDIILKSIEIKDGEKTMSGAFTVDADGKANITATDKAGITLGLGEGKALGKAANYFNIAIPAGSYQDLTLVFTATDGTECKMTGGKIDIPHNTVSRLTLAGTFKPFIPDPVDLGLPSGILWASFNLGAYKPEDYGGYYQWAGTTDVSDKRINLDWSNCPYHTGSDRRTGWTKYIPSSKSSYWSGFDSPDNKTVLDPEDDVAHVKLGGKWRIPTKAEWDELRNTSNCSWIWTSINGINGYKVQSMKDGYTDNWIFLPAAGYRYYDYLLDDASYGYYWSSSLNTVYPYTAYYLYFYSDLVDTYYDNRCDGRSVRPVSE